MRTTEYEGTADLTMTFEIDPTALNSATYTVERRSGLLSPQGREENEAIEISSQPSPNNPALLEVTFRSLVPFGQDRMEFLRLRHESLGN